MSGSRDNRKESRTPSPKEQRQQEEAPNNWLRWERLPRRSMDSKGAHMGGTWSSVWGGGIYLPRQNDLKNKWKLGGQRGHGRTCTRREQERHAELGKQRCEQGWNTTVRGRVTRWGWRCKRVLLRRQGRQRAQTGRHSSWGALGHRQGKMGHLGEAQKAVGCGRGVPGGSSGRDTGWGESAFMPHSLYQQI